MFNFNKKIHFYTEHSFQIINISEAFFILYVDKKLTDGIGKHWLYNSIGFPFISSKATLKTGIHYSWLILFLVVRSAAVMNSRGAATPPPPHKV